MAAKVFGALSTGIQTTTATGAITPTTGLDISVLSTTQDFTVWLQVESLTAAKKIAISLEDSVNGFTAAVPLAVINVAGAITEQADLKFSWRKYQLPSLRAGVSAAVARLNVVAIDSATTATLRAWIEYN